MENMLCSQNKGYILPKPLRTGYMFFGFLSSIGLLGFALFMLWLAIDQDTDKIPCFLIAIIFGTAFIVYLLAWIKNRALIESMYYVNNSVAINCVNNIEIQVPMTLNSVRNIDHTHRFYIGKGSLQMKYTIYSATISDREANELCEDNIYKLLKTIWASNSVIIPQNVVD